jgi:hypothetical protein
MARFRVIVRSHVATVPRRGRKRRRGAPDECLLGDVLGGAGPHDRYRQAENAALEPLDERGGRVESPVARPARRVVGDSPMLLRSGVPPGLGVAVHVSLAVVLRSG